MHSSPHSFATFSYSSYLDLRVKLGKKAIHLFHEFLCFSLTSQGVNNLCSVFTDIHVDDFQGLFVPNLIVPAQDAQAHVFGLALNVFIFPISNADRSIVLLFKYVNELVLKVAFIFIGAQAAQAVSESNSTGNGEFTIARGNPGSSIGCDDGGVEALVAVDQMADVSAQGN